MKMFKYDKKIKMENLIILNPENEKQLIGFDENLDLTSIDAEELTYIVLNGTRDKVKIGKTTAGVVSTRMSSLKTSDPDITKLIIFPKCVYSEEFLHQKFKKYHWQREWYFYVEEIKTFIIEESQQLDQLQKYYQAILDLDKLKKSTSAFFQLNQHDIETQPVESLPQNNSTTKLPTHMKIGDINYTIEKYRDIYMNTFKYLVDNNLFTETLLPFSLSETTRAIIVDVNDNVSFENYSYKKYKNFKYCVNYSGKDCIKIAKKLIQKFSNKKMELIY